jgi:glycosyltransferase involved in cell wall biosynthesis
MIKSSQVPLVSILCPTFNHEKYISQTLEGFLIQETNFPFEIIVHDDASTDRTVDIIRDFEKRFPGKFSNIYQTENQYSKGGGNSIIKILLAASNKKYIALCEGDDFWTDPHKLQKQIDFLESNTEYVLCSANAQVLNSTGKPFRNIYCEFGSDRSFDQIGILMEFYCPTMTMVFRNQLDNIPNWFYEVKSGDTFLHLLLSRYGKFYFMNFIAGIYRQHDKGISNNIDKALWFENNIIHLNKLRPILKPESKPYLDEVIYKNQIEYIYALRETKRYKKAFVNISRIKHIPFSFRKEYFLKVSYLLVKIITRS